MPLVKISIAGTMKSHTIAIVLEALTASEQKFYSTVSAITTGNPSRNRGELNHDTQDITSRG